MVKKLTTLKVILQNRKVTRNKCYNNLLEYLLSPTGKPLYVKLVVVTKDDNKKYGHNSPKKNEDPGCFSVPVTIEGFYVGEMMCDLVSSANMMSLSLFDKIGGMELKPCKLRIWLVDGSLKNVKGVIKTVNINIDGFIFPIEVVVMEMKGLDKVQMILRSHFLATARAIINMNQGEIIIRSWEDCITYRVFGQYRCPRKKGVSKEEVKLKVEDQE